MRKLEILSLFFLVVIALSLRLYKIDRPLGDWHSWRQADTAAVSRNFIKEGYNPFIPKFDDMSTQANGLDNPNRYRFVEFPIYNTVIAAVWSVTGVNVTYARLTTVAITLLSMLLLYFIVRNFSGPLTAFLSAFFFAVIPYNVFYSSTILPGPMMVFCLLATYLTFIYWLKKENNWFLFILSIIFANLAILTWPIALFFFLPLVYLVWEKYSFNFAKITRLWIFAALTIAPFIIWRIYIMNFPEGIPNWRFLINENNIRFKGAFFRWLVIERMGNLILTLGGFSLFILGLVKKPSREKLFYFSLLASVALYFSVFASGNVRHDYYQIPAIPAFAIFMALGTKMLIFPPTNLISVYAGRIIATFSIIFLLVFGFYEIRGFYWINKPAIITAGAAVDRLLPKDATVIAPYNGDAAFLYQTNRYGYPITDRPLEKFIEDGTKYLVSVDVNDAGIQNLARNCKVIEQRDEYVIVEMFKECIGK